MTFNDIWFNDIWHLMPNVWHLSTRMMKSAQVARLIKMLHKSWLFFSNFVTVAVSSVNWNHCFGDKQPWYKYPMHSTFSDLKLLIKVMTIWLKSNGDRLSYWRTLTAQKTKFSVTDFFIKYDQIPRKLRIWSHLLKKSLMKTSFLRNVSFKL